MLLAQQAAEKALKAGLGSLDVDPPRVHKVAKAVAADVARPEDRSMT